MGTAGNIIVENTKKVLEFIERHPKGIDKTDVVKVSGLSPQESVAAVNLLLTQRKLELLENGVIRLKDSRDEQLQESEKLVYHLISEASTSGIWARDLKDKCGLLRPQLTKVIKSLESKQKIKSVKGVTAQHSKKIFYFRADVTPDRSITGGAFHNESELDISFTTALNKLCTKYFFTLSEKVKDEPLPSRLLKSYASVQDLFDFIEKSGISNISLLVEDVECIISSLVFDDAIKESVVGKPFTPIRDIGNRPLQLGAKVYRWNQSTKLSNGFLSTVCGFCPVFRKCRENFIISPSTCQYMAEWLEN
ncbi:DNA-directed RNA polymerase III subunit RPC6-like [Zophobas morio]|uniref:DNA-directed RNA polymerase III subunit RPC6-like n=1 Tax=Zophobas morio TaxID=2755281 RepID=UPI0030832DE9